MEIFKTKDGKSIIYENGIAEVFDLKELEAEKASIEERIGINSLPKDSELLTWAKKQYPAVNHSEEFKRLEGINETISLIK